MSRADRSVAKRRAEVDVEKARQEVNKLEAQILRTSDPVKVAELRVKLAEAKNRRTKANKVIRPNNGKKKKAKGPKKGSFVGALFGNG